MMGSKSARYTLRRAFLFGLLGGCFVTLVAVVVAVVFVLSGLISLGSVSTAIYWALGIFGVSSVTLMLAVLVYESFCEP
jgi:Mg/Co/Ni transporter MgtE